MSRALEVENPELAEGVIDLLAQGASVRQAGKALGVPKSVVHKLAKRNKPLVDTRGRLTWAEFGEKFKEKLRDGLDSLTKAKLDKASVRDISILTGIFADKALVIDGRPNVIQSMQVEDRRGLSELLIVVARELGRRQEARVLAHGNVECKGNQSLASGTHGQGAGAQVALDS